MQNNSKNIFTLQKTIKQKPYCLIVKMKEVSKNIYIDELSQHLITIKISYYERTPKETKGKKIA